MKAAWLQNRNPVAFVRLLYWCPAPSCNQQRAESETEQVSCIMDDRAERLILNSFLGFGKRVSACLPQAHNILGASGAFAGAEAPEALKSTGNVIWELGLWACNMGPSIGREARL